MTRKDYLVLAAALAGARPDIEDKSFTHHSAVGNNTSVNGIAFDAAHGAWIAACGAIADALSDDNSRFDRCRFIEATLARSRSIAATCDICGELWEDGGEGEDWNGETGSHVSCESPAAMQPTAADYRAAALLTGKAPLRKWKVVDPDNPVIVWNVEERESTSPMGGTYLFCPCVVWQDSVSACRHTRGLAVNEMITAGKGGR